MKTLKLQTAATKLSLFTIGKHLILAPSIFNYFQIPFINIFELAKVSTQNFKIDSLDPYRVPPIERV